MAGPEAWGGAFAALPAWAAVASGLGFFATLYVAICGGNWLLTRHVLPTLGWGRPIDPRPLQPRQVRREIRASLVSVAIFGVGTALPWWFLQQGWAGLAVAPGGLRILAEIALLLAWNEVHFYASHRLLHTRPFRRWHGAHHRSVVATPWSTYSFHPVEAMLLGNVILWPMLVHDFSFAALLALPVASLVLNTLGHANYDYAPGVGDDHWLAASRRHQLHHARSHGNYGFLATSLDRWFGTRIEDRPAHPG